MQPDLDAGHAIPPARLVGGHCVQLLQGGDELFPRMVDAMAAARDQVWLATYIFHDDVAGRRIAEALGAAARRGVAVRVVVDGFGSKATLAQLRSWLVPQGVMLEVFRPIDRWWTWLLPSQLRRLHQKLCVVDAEVAFVGGINIIDDRNDLTHGVGETPRLDFAVSLQGPLVQAVRTTAQAMWTRASLGHRWRDEVRSLAGSARPMDEAIRLVRRLRGRSADAPAIDSGIDRAAALVNRCTAQQVRDAWRFVEALEVTA